MRKNGEINSENQQFGVDYDETHMGFKATPQEQVLNWRTFKCNFTSDEPDCTTALTEIVDHYPDEMIDLRPYFQQVPFVV